MATVRSGEEMLKFKTAVLNAIKESPGISSSELMEIFPNEVTATMLWHLRVMSKRGMLDRKKENGVYYYTITPGAFSRLEREYKNRKQTVSFKSKDNDGLIDVSVPTLKLTINGDVKEVSIESARSLYFKLKKVFGDD